MKTWKHIFFSVGLLAHFQMFAQAELQDSTIWADMLKTVAEETVITASRADRSLSNITVPTTIIQGQTIQKAGLVKLSDVLQEQSGLMVTSSAGSSAIGGGIFGNGIQIQGLSPDYTLIMLDGEPVIGRQGGVLDLSRFTVGNIRKIEIVKGPSSALYGSEAMGGVVNILTDQKRDNQKKLSLRYGSFNTLDIFGSINQQVNRSSLYMFANYNRSDGYDLTPKTAINTIDPHEDYTVQFRWTYRFSDKTRLVWSNRFFSGQQSSFFSINNESLKINGKGTTTDFNISPVVFHRWNENVHSTLRLYVSQYSYDQSLVTEKNETYYKDDFNQNYFRAEQQNDWNVRKNLTFITGLGVNHQSVETQRYKNVQFQNVAYIFAQAEFLLQNKWSVIPGIRYDVNSAYANRLSPKISLLYKINEVSRMNTSYGSGFKAPDFRQLYLSYANPAAQGYRVFGVEEFSMETMEKELASGQITKILPEAYLITTLSPEISHGFNVAYHYSGKTKKVNFDVNLFYNDIQNLINYLPVALQSNGTYVFSYRNTKRAFTSGLECNVSGVYNKNFEWSAGYQFLFTGEQATLEAIKDQKVYGRPGPLSSARLMNIFDYSGLLGRSPHMANVKLMYHFPKTEWTGTARVMYRSRWGVVDLDGNGFANMKEEYANGFFNLNLSIQKSFYKFFTVQLAANNLLNHKDEINTPNLAGTNILTTIFCNF